MSAITMDWTSMETMDGINPWEASITMDFLHPAIWKDIQASSKKWNQILKDNDIQSNPKKWKLTI